MDICISRDVQFTLTVTHLSNKGTLGSKVQNKNLTFSFFYEEFFKLYICLKIVFYSFLHKYNLGHCKRLKHLKRIILNQEVSVLRLPITNTGFLYQTQ